MSRRLEIGSRVHGRLAWDRRFHFMQQHLGQHILSAVFVEQLDANTVGLRFGVK
jgi:alanyl-tRNA synthetase